MAADLEGVVATSTRLSHVDGEAGRLTIAGYAVEDLAPYARFEEVAFLLLHARLPDPSELARFTQDLAGRRALPRAGFDVLRAAAAAQAPPMDVLRMAAALLSLGRQENPLDDALTAIACFPTIVGAYWRVRNGEAPVPVRPDLPHAAHYLQQVFGAEPSAERARALETYLNTVCDHGLNASTFAARVIVSTRSDVISAITGAVGALKGPLHGGAPGPALDMVFEIGTPERAEPVIRAKLDRGERLMGFGHRIYRVRDPRADVLAQAAQRFYSSGGDQSLYELAQQVEATALRLLRERKPERRLDTNVEFYTALLLHGLGFPSALFTPTFAVGRVVGWSAHCLEQLREGRLIRPQSAYVGPTDLHYDRGARHTRSQ
ncbi:MAG: citrate synthase/methylcitrate synthase [Gemmatimonadetes bacterium 13_1_20CM_69_28]|nr:MAG: citrate synthase/methylcitrate synthase [Gemmatimonadetes bacterium 13_2_20CM_2_69_23]OLD58494.1 MAG: citrate synthase/methylcitrate synthase [Gemmatimonadetes bacterium 13_1_20CM_69_28]